MKTFAIASMLFAGAALAAPVNEVKRAVQTDVVVTTIWTTTTIFVNEPSRGVFAERPSSSIASSSATPSSSSVAPPASSSPPPAVVAAVASVAAPVASVAAPVAAAAATTAAAPAAAAAQSGSGPSGTGSATYYTVSNGAAGSCGMTKTDNDAVVALSLATMNNGANSNNNPLCGKTINIQGETGVFQAIVYDSCEGCASGDIDLSPSLFKAAFPHGDGRVHGVKWWVS